MFKKKPFHPLAFAVAALSASCGYAATATLEEVIVTAAKTEESQQIVPVAMVALTADALEKRGVTDSTDLSGSVPNLVVSSPFGRTQPNFSIRGISVANEYNSNAASPIGFYVNEDYKQFRPTHGAQLFDLERVEVIRGPQGTLFGRNTTGGAVSVTTKRPEIDEVGAFSGHVTGGLGNYSSRSFDGAVNTTLVGDVLAMRLAATINKRDGYLKNRTPDTVPTALVQAGAPAAVLQSLGLPTTKAVNANTHHDFASVDDRAARLSLLFTPSDAFEAFFTYTKGKASPYGAVPIIREVANGGATDLFGYSRAGLDDDEVESDSNGKYKTDSDDYMLSLNWSVADNLSLISVTGYGEGSSSVDGDCDGLAIASCFQSFNSDFDQFNQDLRFSWEADKGTLIGGLYYGQDNIKSKDRKNFYAPLADFAGLPTAAFQAIASDTSGIFPADLQARAGAIAGALTGAGLSAYPMFNPPIPAWMAPPPQGLGAFLGDPANPLLTATGFGSANSFDQERESKAIYMEGKYYLTDEATLTVGLRYTEDDFNMRKLRAAIYDSYGNPQFNSIPVSPVADSSLVAPDQKGSSDEFTGRVIFDYKFDYNMMGFMSYSRGYRAGTINGSANQSIAQATFVEPEFVDNYEMGFKSRWLDDTLQVNATYFYADYKDQQVQEVIGATTFLRNASGVLQGAEAEIQWQPTSDLFTSVGLGYIKSEYDDKQYFAGPGNAGANCSAGPAGVGAAFAAQCVDIGGNQFPFAPELNANLFVEWTAGRWDAGDLTFAVTMRYQDEIWFDPFNDDKSSQLPPSSMRQGGYTLFDANASFGNDVYQVRVWGKNLTDKYYNSYGIDTAGGFGVDYLIRGEPRTFGMDATYHF